VVRVILALILLFALALRLLGIGWGLPNILHYFSYHPDETHILMACTPAWGGLNLFAGHILPSFYNYGSLQLYLINIAVSFGSAYGAIGPVVDRTGIVVQPVAWSHAFLAARLLTVLMGTATVWVVYAIGSRLWSQTAGLVAALLLALMPLHAQHSHFATVDVPATLWITLSLLWSIHAWQDTVKVNRAFLLAGVLAGLATATKYNSALVFLPVIVASFLRPTPALRATPPASGGGGSVNKASGSGNEHGKLASPSRSVAQSASANLGKGAGGLGVGLLGFLLAFILACPGAILDNHKFVSDFLFEARHVSQQGEIYFQQTGLGWVYIITRNLDAGLGLPLLLLSLAGIGYAIWRRKSEDWLLLAFALPYYLVIGAAQSRYARYEIPLLPVLALWSARFLVDFGAIKDPRRPAAIAIGALVVLFTLADTLFLLKPMTVADPRDRAAIWLQQNAPAPTPIGFTSTPWFWSPAVNPYFGLPGVGQWKQVVPLDQAARFIYNPDKAFDAQQLEGAHPPFVALTESEYFDYLRLRKLDALAYLSELSRDYRLAATFSDLHPMGGDRSIDGLPIQDLPPDMLYPSPHILVFTRR
jgi:4-amino-4-deoxy-L-arabinose transferase-like glycosyltransferase